MTSQRPPHSPSLPQPLYSHRRFNPGQKRSQKRRCPEKQTQTQSHYSHTQQAKEPFTAHAHTTHLAKQGAQAGYTHAKQKTMLTYCMGWQDWAFCSPGPRWRGEEQVHLVLVSAQLHAVGPPWAIASPAAAGCVTARSASDWTLAPLHGSSPTSTPLQHTATWRTHMPMSELPPCVWLDGLIAEVIQTRQKKRHFCEYINAWCALFSLH